MRTIERSSQFKKDFKKIVRQGKDLKKLTAVIDLLKKGQPLPERCRDHELKGNKQSYRDCHIEPDWVLIYDTSQEGVLRLVRTGSHAELFKK